MPDSLTLKDRQLLIATVVSNEALCRGHFRLVLRVPSYPPTHPGQFIQLQCADVRDEAPAELEHEWSDEAPLRLGGHELNDPEALLRRPFSLAGREDQSDGSVHLHVIHHVVGVGTAWLAQLKPADRVDVLGPLGNHFALPPEDAVSILIGGGVGIPPLLYLAERLVGRRAIAFIGSRTRELLPLCLTDAAPPPERDAVSPLYNVTEFARHGIPAVISTDDGSWGYHGLVTTALENYLIRYLLEPGPSGNGSGAHHPLQAKVRVQVYTCGPEPMMRAVAELCARYSLACEVCVERAMACGMGTCQSCCIRVKSPQARDGWLYRLACTDGPIFPAKELLW